VSGKAIPSDRSVVLVVVVRASASWLVVLAVAILLWRGLIEVLVGLIGEFSSVVLEWLLLMLILRRLMMMNWLIIYEKENFQKL
jgi:hypothetical protein